MSTRQVFGYVNLPSQRTDVERDVATARREIATYAESEGYDLAGVFTDIDPTSQRGLDALKGAVRNGDVAAVIVPDMEQLTHLPCLLGADLPTAGRYVGAPVLPVHDS
ncbi:recombinase family protein [Kineosporia sp. A_224]|uniref:recombinase family protein n=1 Tax=Kineosporia sp. A_224 TaxID=1962180 RepID=UPI000B4A6723|nr:recombinase family protein [Kineosporia sp. A_224]